MRMKRAVLDDIVVEYIDQGSGDAVIFVHHGAGTEWFEPLFREPALHTRFHLLRYHRPGYAASSTVLLPYSFSREAPVLRALVHSLGIQRAHVVGHSASACIALQIALDDPETVGSLALLEPALMAVPSPPEVPRAIEQYRSGETAAAVDTFLRGTCGAAYRSVLTVVDGAIDQAITDAATFFEHELPALRQWRFGPDEARRLSQPALAVVGEQSDARFHARHKLLLEWLPDVEEFVLPGAGHLLHLQNAAGMADGLARFFQRHALGAGV